MPKLMRRLNAAIQACIFCLGVSARKAPSVGNITTKRAQPSLVEKSLVGTSLTMIVARGSNNGGTAERHRMEPPIKNAQPTKRPRLANLMVEAESGSYAFMLMALTTKTQRCGTRPLERGVKH